MIITNYHEVTALKLSPIKTLPAPDQVTWRVLEVETTTETHMINFFPGKDNGNLNIPAAAPVIEILGLNQTSIQIGDKTYFYSYQDCVGFCQGKTRIFRDDNHSLTTKKHIAKMCKGFKPVPPSDFYALISE